MTHETFVFFQLLNCALGIWTIQGVFGLIRAARRPGSWLNRRKI